MKSKTNVCVIAMCPDAAILTWHSMKTIITAPSVDGILREIKNELS